MVVCAEQPHYLPWLDFYEELARSDAWVVLDDVQWLRRGWQRRTRVALPRSAAAAPPPRPGEPQWQWLTIPLAGVHRDQELRELRIEPASGWARRHRATLDHLYARRPFYATQVAPVLDRFFGEVREEASLLSVLVASTLAFAEPLGVRPRVVLASTLDRSDPDRTGRLVSMATQLCAGTYYSGLGSVLYLKPARFRDAGVRLVWQRFRHPPYEQGRGRPFAGGLSVVDALANVPLDTVREWLRPAAFGPFAPG